MNNQEKIAYNKGVLDSFQEIVEFSEVSANLVGKIKKLFAKLEKK